MIKRSVTAIVLVSSVLYIGCGGADTSSSSGTAPSTAGAPTLDELRNLTYTGLGNDPRTVTLKDGRWEGAPYVEGVASRPRVDAVDNLRLVGDLDADGSDEAVTLLAQHGGGTGEYLYLSVVDRIDRGPVNTATTRVGDRVQVRRATIDSGTIVLNVVQAGPDDAMCCPGDLVTRRWTLGEDGLRELEPLVTGRLGPGMLAGSVWTLTRWRSDEPAPDTPHVTLTYADGSFAGSSGCNWYFAAVTEGDTPGTVRLGPIGGTMMACSEQEMAVETRYLTLLGLVEKMSFQVGRFALTYAHDDTMGTLLFERQPDSEADESG